MGVPAFFRWLSGKYPSIVVHCVEEKSRDSSQPNPNDVEFDNLYLDMNGIIHLCTHPEDKPAPENEQEMMILIFEYIDRIFSIVRPRRLLYMAIDGVAPKAKMNKQRSRRFRASKESIESAEEIARVREELFQKGRELPPEKPTSEKFDRNCITPGTPFMFWVADCLRFYIYDRLNNDPGWRNLKVILSDANVPGEVEHKIMDYIRRQRAQPYHDPNTKHCLCGADADLIMLGLATHEPNFTIIREEFTYRPRPCPLCGQIGHELKECQGLPKGERWEFDHLSAPISDETPFIFLRLNVLREYLERELHMPILPFPYDFERALDDWVFMCFFVGNDFLPPIPSLEIREGAIDRLVRLYKDTVRKTGGYLTDRGVVALERVQLIMQELGEEEDEVFKRRREDELKFRERNKQRRRRNRSYDPLGEKRWRDEAEDSDSEPEPEDDVKLWEDGWKDRYYKNKFDVGAKDTAFRHKVANHYVHGLCWVLRYYYQGCASWKWYFPYHYAPFASDFVNIASQSNAFEKDTKPLRPLEQLMGVLPAASKQHLPRTWQTLMTNPKSPIIDFYPINFRIDLNGKKYAWQGVTLLPFVDEVRLRKALDSVYPDLTKAEIKRNVQGNDRLFVRQSNSTHSFLEALYESGSDDIGRLDINPKLTDGMAGKVWRDEYVYLTGETIRSPLPQLHHLKKNKVISVQFQDPQYDRNYLFPAKLLPGAVSGVSIPPPSFGPGFNQGYNQNNRGGGRGGYNSGGYNSSSYNTGRGGYGSGGSGGYGGRQQGGHSSFQRDQVGQMNAYQRNMQAQRGGYNQGGASGYGYDGGSSYGGSYSSSRGSGSQYGGSYSSSRGGQQGGYHQVNRDNRDQRDRNNWGYPNPPNYRR